MGGGCIIGVGVLFLPSALLLSKQFNVESHQDNHNKHVFEWFYWASLSSYNSYLSSPVFQNKATLHVCVLNFGWVKKTGKSLPCKQALRMGYSEICFRIARGVQERRASNGLCTIWVLPPFPLDWSFTLRHCLTQQKATVAHSNRKTRTTQADISVKKSENYCLKAKPWMGTSFRNVPYMSFMKKWPWQARNENERKKQSRLHN